MVSEGYKFAAVPLAAGIAATVCARLFGAAAWLDALAILLLVLAAFVLYFFRDPDREIPADPDAVVSPADGRVTVVVDEAFDGQPGRRISIFLSVFDVHVNRAPVSGTIAALDYRRGSFHGALFERASAENEQNVIRLRTPRGEMAFKQIAGLIARRILFWKARGESVSIGDRVGMIRFGSRVDVWLPLGAEIAVRPGDTVRGGASILARWKQ
jgi:phosphatidylserine decarboxylase